MNGSGRRLSIRTIMRLNLNNTEAHASLNHPSQKLGMEQEEAKRIGLFLCQEDFVLASKVMRAGLAVLQFLCC